VSADRAGVLGDLGQHLRRGGGGRERRDELVGALGAGVTAVRSAPPTSAGAATYAVRRVAGRGEQGDARGHPGGQHRHHHEHPPAPPRPAQVFGYLHVVTIVFRGISSASPRTNRRGEGGEGHQIPEGDHVGQHIGDRAHRHEGDGAAQKAHGDTAGQRIGRGPAHRVHPGAGPATTPWPGRPAGRGRRFPRTPAGSRCGVSWPRRCRAGVMFGPIPVTGLRSASVDHLPPVAQTARASVVAGRAAADRLLLAELGEPVGDPRAATPPRSPRPRRASR